MAVFFINCNLCVNSLTLHFIQSSFSHKWYLQLYKAQHQTLRGLLHEEKSNVNEREPGTRHAIFHYPGEDFWELETK